MTPAGCTSAKKSMLATLTRKFHEKPKPNLNLPAQFKPDFNFLPFTDHVCTFSLQHHRREHYPVCSAPIRSETVHSRNAEAGEGNLFDDRISFFIFMYSSRVIHRKRKQFSS